MKYLILVFVLASASLRAQKIAHLDFDSLVARMPETKKVRELAEKYLAEINQNMAAMDDELQKKAKIYLDEKDKLSEAARKMREEELSMMQQKIQFFRQQAEEDYQNKVAEWSMPLVEKAKKGIEFIAKEKGYKYVFDLSGRILYSEPGDNILDLTQKKLGTLPPAKIPGDGASDQKKPGGR